MARPRLTNWNELSRKTLSNAITYRKRNNLPIEPELQAAYDYYFNKTEAERKDWSTKTNQQIKTAINNRNRRGKPIDPELQAEYDMRKAEREAKRLDWSTKTDKQIKTAIHNRRFQGKPIEPELQAEHHRRQERRKAERAAKAIAAANRKAEREGERLDWATKTDKQIKTAINNRKARNVPIEPELQAAYDQRIAPYVKTHKNIDWTKKTNTALSRAVYFRKRKGKPIEAELQAEIDRRKGQHIKVDFYKTDWFKSDYYTLRRSIKYRQDRNMPIEAELQAAYDQRTAERNAKRLKKTDYDSKDYPTLCRMIWARQQRGTKIAPELQAAYEKKKAERQNKEEQDWASLSDSQVFRAVYNRSSRGLPIPAKLQEEFNKRKIKRITEKDWSTTNDRDVFITVTYCSKANLPVPENLQKEFEKRTNERALKPAKVRIRRAPGEKIDWDSKPYNIISRTINARTKAGRFIEPELQAAYDKKRDAQLNPKPIVRKPHIIAAPRPQPVVRGTKQVAPTLPSQLNVGVNAATYYDKRYNVKINNNTIGQWPSPQIQTFFDDRVLAVSFPIGGDLGTLAYAIFFSDLRQYKTEQKSKFSGMPAFIKGLQYNDGVLGLVLSNNNIESIRAADLPINVSKFKLNNLSEKFLAAQPAPVQEPTSTEPKPQVQRGPYSVTKEITPNGNADVYLGDKMILSDVTNPIFKTFFNDKILGIKISAPMKHWHIFMPGGVHYVPTGNFPINTHITDVQEYNKFLKIYLSNNSHVFHDCHAILELCKRKYEIER